VRRVFFAVLVSACGGSATSGPAPVTLAAPSATTHGPEVQVAHEADAGVALLSGPRLCGCSLCEPLLSEDACKLDSDCLPATPCHASACVSAPHAQLRAPTTQCTQEYRCDTVDANRCACVRGRCALAPRN
jgi:hypothetical protein